MPSELRTLPAPLAPGCALLSLLLLPEADGVGVLVGVAVVDVVVVPDELLLVAEVAVVAVLFVLVLALEAVEPPGTRPSWLSAEKMLSMKPIMPPPDCWPSCTF